MGRNFNKRVSPPPPYSMDLALCNFGFFYRITMKLKYRNLGTLKEIQAPVLDTFTEAHIQKIFQQWKTRWNCRIRAKEVYNEGNGGHKLEN